jgi:hypothetical protein
MSRHPDATDAGTSPFVELGHTIAPHQGHINTHIYTDYRKLARPAPKTQFTTIDFMVGLAFFCSKRNGDGGGELCFNLASMGFRARFNRAVTLYLRTARPEQRVCIHWFLRCTIMAWDAAIACAGFLAGTASRSAKSVTVNPVTQQKYIAWW